ncbi:MAG: hypothetical protein ACK5JI_07080 [Azonexus sp.]
MIGAEDGYTTSRNGQLNPDLLHAVEVITNGLKRLDTAPPHSEPIPLDIELKALGIISLSRMAALSGTDIERIRIFVTRYGVTPFAVDHLEAISAQALLIGMAGEDD